MKPVSPVSWKSVFPSDLSIDGVCLICHLMECVSSLSWWSMFHLICHLMGWYTSQLMERVSPDLSVDGVCFTWSVSWWGDIPVSWWSISLDLSVDGVIYLSVDRVCFTWSVSWWSDLPVSLWSVFHLICQLMGWLPVSWWSVFHLICQLMEYVSPDLSVDGVIYLLVDGVCFTWSLSWWSDLPVSWWSVFHLICQLMGVIYLSVDGVFHLIYQLMGWYTCHLMECFTWSVSWWGDLPVSWWSVFHLICQLMECVSPDLSVDGMIYLSVDGVCFTWSVSWWGDLPVSWWSVFHHNVTCQLICFNDCSLNSWYIFDTISVSVMSFSYLPCEIFETVHDNNVCIQRYTFIPCFGPRL